MTRVSIVTDSTAYLPDEFVRQYGITVLPLSIVWQDRIYRDGIDIQPEEFYTRLAESTTFPTTSQVTAPSFASAFTHLLSDGADVLGIFLSSRLSGTYEAALQTRKMMPDVQDKIALVDSRLTTGAMALPVLMAARAACAGEGLASCRKVAEEACDRSGVLFVVETLEFLRRGGRLGGAQAMLGTVLNIKPVLAMRDGLIEALERVRTKRAALERMLAIVADRIGGQSQVSIATSHANAEAEAVRLLAAASSNLQPIESFCRPLSPVIGAHVGPGTVALAYMTGAD